MSQCKTTAEWMTELALSLDEMVERSALDRRVVEAIIQNRYTPSPAQRLFLAAALGVAPDQVLWGHATQVAHVYGHGPQFGRSP
jgi:hypothetical protein